MKVIIKYVRDDGTEVNKVFDMNVAGTLKAGLELLENLICSADGASDDELLIEIHS